MSQSAPHQLTNLPGHACQVFDADSIYVIHGVNSGEGLMGPDEVCEGDIYALEAGSVAQRLVLQLGIEQQMVAEGSQIGRVGQSVRYAARYTLMSSDGDKIEIVLIELAGGGSYALPLSPISAQLDYTLVDIESSPEAAPLSDLLCVSFSRGTMISLADGRQVPIESLVPGDRVLTRDHGAQPVRWLGRATVRAVGSFAPVIITAGTLGNIGDLVVSPHHRIFVYHRNSGLGTSELLIQSKHLVDGDAIYQREGGYVDYFSLVFDRHEIIYAEGVPVESLMVTEATLRRLPPEMAQDVQSRFPGLAHSQHFGTEAGRHVLEHVRPTERFRKRAT